MPGIDLFTVIEGFLAGAIAFFWNVVGSFGRLLKDPRQAPSELLARFQNKDLRQVGPFTLLFLPWFLVCFTDSRSIVDWQMVARQEAATTVADYRNGSQFLDAFVGATVATIVFDLTLRLFELRDTRGMRLTDVQRSNYRALVRYIFALPVLVITVLSLAANAVSDVTRFDLAPVLVSQIIWLFVSSRLSFFHPAGIKRGLRRLIPTSYGFLTLLSFDVAEICGGIASGMSSQVERTAERLYPERIYLQETRQRCVVADGRLLMEISVFNPSSYAALIPKFGRADVLDVVHDTTTGKDTPSYKDSTGVPIESDAKMASGDIIAPKGLMTIAYHSTQSVTQAQAKKWQFSRNTHCQVRIYADDDNTAVLFGDLHKFGDNDPD